MANIKPLQGPMTLREMYPVVNENLTNLNGDIANAITDISETNKRVSNIVAQAGDSNTEIVDARGVAPVLGERLNGLDAQLAETEQNIAELMEATDQQISQLENVKANKADVRANNKLIEPEDASPRLMSLVTGEGTVNMESIPQNRSVTPVKTTFITEGKNLFNYRNVLVGYVYDASGNLTPLAGSNTSEFIAINSLEKYTLKEISGVIAYFDADKNFISLSSTSASQTLNIPPNAVYVRFSVSDARLKTQQLERGEVSTAYEPYIVTSAYLVGNAINLNDSEMIYNLQGDVSEIIERRNGVIVKHTVITYTNNEVSSIIVTADNMRISSAMVRDGAGNITAVNKINEVV